MVSKRVFAIALIVVGKASGGLIITPTFTSNFTTYFGASAIAAEAAFNSATAIYTNAFDNPITINITVDAVTGTGTLGMSSSPIYSISSWNALESAVVANDTGPLGGSGAQLTSIGAGGSISGGDPTSGSGTFWLTRAQAKALNLLSNDSTNDGTVTVGTGFAYTFDDSGGVAAGTYDLTDIFAHEISEIMGRIGISGGTIGGHPNSYTLLDALAFQGPGSRGLGFVNNDYFSINDGTTLLTEFNGTAGEDSRDWAGATSDAFNASSSTGALTPVSAIDLEELNVLGYDASTPEPSTGILLLSALVAGWAVRRKITVQ
jgi:hypothetical protein